MRLKVKENKWVFNNFNILRVYFLFLLIRDYMKILTNDKKCFLCMILRGEVLFMLCSGGKMF